MHVTLRRALATAKSEVMQGTRLTLACNILVVAFCHALVLVVDDLKRRFRDFGNGVDGDPACIAQSGCLASEHAVG